MNKCKKEITSSYYILFSGCKIIGMFLPFPNDTCKYYTCQDKPWQDGGAASVIKTAMPCPHGQSVAEDYKGGYSNPCTVPSQRCSIPSKDIFKSLYSGRT